MTQLYKKIGFLMMFLMLVSGVKEVNGQAQMINVDNQDICILPNTSLVTIPVGGGLMRFITSNFCDNAYVGANFNFTPSPFNVNWEYAIGSSGFTLAQSGTFLTEGFIEPTSVDICDCYPYGQPPPSPCISGPGGNGGYSETSSSSPSIDLNIPTSNFTTATTLQVRVSIPGSAWDSRANIYTFFYTILPPTPTISNISTTEICFGSSAGTLTFNATSYTDAKVYLTMGAFPTTFTVVTSCGSTNPEYPFCGTTSLPASYPALGLTNNILNSANVPITYNNLPEGEYYITIVNVVSKPFICYVSEPIQIKSTPRLKGRYYGMGNQIPTPEIGASTWFTQNTNLASYMNASNTTSNLYTQTVFVPVSTPIANSQFISNFTPLICADSNDGSVDINGEGGKTPPIFEIKRKYIPKNQPATSVPLEIIISNNGSFTTTTLLGHTVASPKYVWTGTLTGLAYGEYTITVTDASCNQVITNTFNIREAIKIEAISPTNAPALAGLNDAFNVINPICTGGNGSAEISIIVNKYHFNNGNYNLATAGLIAWKIEHNGISPTFTVPFEYTNMLTNTNFSLNAPTYAGDVGKVDDPFFINALSNPGNKRCIIRFPSLPSGNYTFTVGMYNGGSCSSTIGGQLVPIATYTFTISVPTPLDVVRTATNTELDVKNITCPNGGSDSYIKVIGAGNSPFNYNYYLFKETPFNSGNYVKIAEKLNITGVYSFDNQLVGRYKVSVKRGNSATCADEYPTQPIEITAPPVFAFTNVAKLNLSCNGVAVADGNITATVGGGTIGTGYQYQLYKLTNFPSAGDYQTSGSVLSISSPSNTFTTRPLDIGFYKVKIIDASNCETYLTQNGSEIFEIQDPLLLVFDAVVFTNVVCIGDLATISPNVSGGTPFATGAPYEFYYNLNGSTTRVPFTATTSLAPGSYTIWVKDSRGCELAHTGVGSPFVVRPTVPSALSVVTDVPLVNGFAITCFNGDDGKIRLTTTGGVPFATGGLYSYQLNANAPITSSLSTYEFAGLRAGAYRVTIKDSYGCELIRDFNLEQSNTIISILSTGTTPTVCPNDLTGKIVVVPSGGAGAILGGGYSIAYRKKVFAPMPELLYSAFISVPQPANFYEITGLSAGTYQIIVKDGNGCSNTLTPLEVVVNSTNPLIQITSVIEQVRCFGESNGSINITPAAGFVVNGYQWTNRPETTNTLTGLVVGNYEVEITYSGGCKEKFSFAITQPDVLAATSASTIACDRLNDGKITLNATGGTLPYSYSINNGVSWIAANTTSKIFENLAPNVYQAKVRDAKNCLVSLADITIRERGDNPQPRFLVATRQNALDTLVLINTSYPEPTSTVWTLDPQAEVISQNKDEVRVKFPAAGNYSVAMNSTFNGCSYLITKNLVISNFDPNDPGMVVGLRPITSAVIVPNPNNGVFTLNVVLTKKQYVKLVVIDAMGNIRYEQNRNADRTLGFSESIILPTDLLDGLYILRVLTDNDAQEVRFTITR